MPFISRRGIVEAIYRGVLKREPDDEGLQHHVKRLRDGAAVATVISDVVNSDERNNPNDHSQNGEFSIFVGHARPKWGAGVVVDVGAKRKPGSNSYDLMKQYAWRGVLIEADERFWPVIEQDFAGLNYKLVRAAISDREGKADFHIGALPSLKPEFVERLAKPTRKIEVSTRRLKPILDEHRVPFGFDLLTIDIEGMDIAVINELVARTLYRPKWIWIEVDHGHGGKTLGAMGFAPEVVDAYLPAAFTLSNLLLRRRLR